MPTDDYSGIYPYVRQRLQDSVLDVDNSDFDTEISRVLRRMLTPYGVAYADLGDADKAWVDEAAGLRTAANLLTPYSTGGANGDLVAEKTETTGRQFAAPVDGGVKAVWEREANYAFAQVSFVKAATPTPTYIGVNGPSRSRRCDL